MEGRFPGTSEGISIDYLSAIDIFDLSSPNRSLVQNTPEISTTPDLTSPEDLSEEDSQLQVSDTEAIPDRVIQTRARTQVSQQLQNTQINDSEDELALLAGDFSLDPQSYKDACASP